MSDLVPIVKSIGAVVAGGIAAIVSYYIASIVAFLIMHGIPLGSAGGPPSALDISAHLTFAAAGSFVGALMTMRIASYSLRAHALALGVLLGAFMFVGFSKPASHWPAWFAYGMAAACACGAFLASRFPNRRSSAG